MKVLPESEELQKQEREVPTEVERLRLVVDGAEVSTESVEEIKLEKRLFLDRVKKLLSGPYHFEPFKFHALDGSYAFAQNPGLEGFCHTLWDLETFCGKELLISQVDYYFPYLCGLLHDAGFHDEAKSIEALQWDPATRPEDKYSRLKAEVERHLFEGRRVLEEQDDARWIRDGCCYQILVRAYNLAERRAVLGQDPENVTGKFFDDIRPSDLPGPVETIRWTGVYPIGLFNAKGNGGGSPFSIKSFTKIDEQHGGPDACARKLHELRSQGIHSIFELLLNHTAVDSELVEEAPDAYIHVREKPWDTRGYYDFTQAKTGERYWIRRGGYLYDGVRFFWDDTLQLDISNPKTRRILIESVKDLIRLYGVDGFRVDMAYQLLHDPFRMNWGNEVKYPLGDKFEDEFLVQLLREVKTEYPKAAFIAEGFWNWEKLNAAGFDLMYGQNDMILAGGFRHHGWYEAMKTRDPWTMTEAIKRAAFLHWQCGGQGMYCFIGHHDLPSPQRLLGDWLWGATFMTLLLPMAHNWYAGTEAGFEDPCDENGKMITFNKRTMIRWRGLQFSFSRFVTGCMQMEAAVRAAFGNIEMKPLWPYDGSGWVGFLLRQRGGSIDGAKVLALANPCDSLQDVHIDRPDLGILDFHTRLEKAGAWGQQLVWMYSDGTTRTEIPGGV